MRFPSALPIQYRVLRPKGVRVAARVWAVLPRVQARVHGPCYLVVDEHTAH